MKRMHCGIEAAHDPHVWSGGLGEGYGDPDFRCPGTRTEGDDA